MRVGIKEGLDREVPEVPEYPNKELHHEVREELILSMVEDNNIVVPEDTLINLNVFIKEEIKVGSRPSNYKKGFTVVDAIVNGNKKVITFASRSLAIKIMRYIRETYHEKIDLKYEITQM